MPLAANPLRIFCERRQAAQPAGSLTVQPFEKEVTMRSDLNDFVTGYLSLVGAVVMLVGFVAFVVTSYDANRSDGQGFSIPSLAPPAQNAGS